MNRRGSRLLASTVMAVMLCAGLCGAPALGQSQQPEEAPVYEKAFSKVFVGGQTPLLDFSQNPWLKGLSISGFYLNTTGMWANSSNLRGLQNVNHTLGFGVSSSKNSLAVERNLAQVDINYTLNENNRFFIRWWGVYEPPYDYERGHGFGEMYNQYTVRDAWWKSKWGPLTLFLGRQIVTWGESLAFRIGDVVNPQDFEWNFGFANLEQSRLPLFMVHPILNLPSVGPFGSNFIEGIWAPPFQPIYTNAPLDFNPAGAPINDFAGQTLRGGSVSLFAPETGGRFSSYFGPQVFPGLLQAIGVPCPISTRGCAPDWPQLTNPSPALTFDNFALPDNNLGGSQGGFRFHTLVANTEITALFWHGHQYLPMFFMSGEPSGPFAQNFQARYSQLNDIGITGNRPIYLPGPTLRNVPLVLRTEAVWQDRTPFQSQDLRNLSAVQYSSTINSLVAFDVDAYYAPWLSHTGALTANLEWNNYTILSPSKTMVYLFTPERWRHNEENLLFAASDSWYWGAVTATFVGIYNPDGSTFLTFPNILFVPPWTSKYSILLEYIGIMSNDVLSAYAGGIFKGKSLLLMQFQYNFSLTAAR